MAAELLGTSTSELARLRQASRVEVAGQAKLTGLRLWRSAEIIIYPPSREKDPPGAPQ
ncbi:MAG TPA: hypothetical protein VGR90_02790 [Acidimicrobiales bacterium]|nr:hypothetical protein [Acidimicrobiales bacterium]